MKEGKEYQERQNSLEEMETIFAHILLKPMFRYIY